MLDDLFARPEPKTLRPHQERALSEIRSALAGHRRVCCSLPTGAGKTTLAAKIMAGAVSKGNRAVFTVPALSLVDQTVAEFEAEGVGRIGVIQADHPRTDPMAEVQVASVQTLARRDFPQAAVVVVDEAHIRSKAIQDWQAQSDAVFVGLTATPGRAGMADEWDALVVGSTIRELIDAGYLSDFRVFAPAEPDLSKVKTVAGDFHQGQASEVMQDAALVGDVVTTWLERGEDRPTLCFAVDRAHARGLASRFEAAGVATGYVDAFTDTVERAVIADRFKRGEIKVVCNVRTLTTGVDWPVGCIVDAAPTKSPMLHVQKIGRGLRVNPGLDDCVIFDHAGNALRNGLVTDIPWSVLPPKSKRGEPKERKKTETMPKACPECAFVKPAKTLICPACGHKSEPPRRDVEAADGELVEFKKGKARKEDKQAWWSGLLQIAKERKRSRGWASHTYRDRFGVWPRGLWDEPGIPRPEVRNFVLAKDIRYAKSQEKRARHA